MIENYLKQGEITQELREQALVVFEKHIPEINGLADSHRQICKIIC